MVTIQKHNKHAKQRSLRSLDFGTLLPQPLAWALGEILKHRISIIIFLITISVFTHSKIAFKSNHHMTQDSDLIAVGEVIDIDKDYFGPNKDKVTFRIEQPIKSDLSGDITIISGSDIICGLTFFKPGKYLLFLEEYPIYFTKDEMKTLAYASFGNLYRSANYQAGIKTLEAGKLSWEFKDDPIYVNDKKKAK
jgi:hypothetical protein